MALVRRPAATALAVVLLASGLVGCAGTGSDQARDENRKMDCLTRCGKELEQQQTARPVLVARSQGPVEELPPVRLGTPTPMPPAPGVPVPVPVGEPADGIRAPDIVAPAVTPASGTGPVLPPLPTTDPGLPAPPSPSPAPSPSPT